MRFTFRTPLRLGTSRSTLDCGTINTTAWCRRTECSRAWGSLIFCLPTRCCEPPTRARLKRRSTKICCYRAPAGTGGLEENVFGTVSNPIRPGNRNDFDTGFQQGIGKWLIIDADYFWKFTHNAYDFDVLFNTPITFPISWNNSKVDGVSGRVSTINLHGFQAYMTLGHTRARYFPPETGGLIALGGIPHRRFQDRPRSGLSAERESALSAPQERGVDRFHLAL